MTVLGDRRIISVGSDHALRIWSIDGNSGPVLRGHKVRVKVRVRVRVGGSVSGTSPPWTQGLDFIRYVNSELKL